MEKYCLGSCRSGWVSEGHLSILGSDFFELLWTSFLYTVGQSSCQDISEENICKAHFNFYFLFLFTFCFNLMRSEGAPICRWHRARCVSLDTGYCTCDPALGKPVLSASYPSAIGLPALTLLPSTLKGSVLCVEHRRHSTDVGHHYHH